jgi:hypothetical protein
MPESLIKTVAGPVSRVNLKTVKFLAVRSVPGVQVTLRVPQELLNNFLSRLDANAYVGQWK